MAPEIMFFIGKGGVGKSTIASLTAVALAQEGIETLLVSMDPAHNLGDIFQARFSDKPRRVANHLMVLEVDLDRWVKNCLKQTEAAIKRHYSYESAFSLEKHFDVLQFSPGAEEYALLMAFGNILQRFKHQHTIIFDMAPTALTLRFFSLPSITRVWLNSLLAIREELYAKKEIISRITIGRKQIEQDAVKTKLAAMLADYRRLGDQFTSGGTRIQLVANEDQLSFAEAYRIKTRLDQIGIQLESVIVNKAQQNEVPAKFRRAFDRQCFYFFPLSSNHLVGIAALENYMRQNETPVLGLNPVTGSADLVTETK